MNYEKIVRSVAEIRIKRAIIIMNCKGSYSEWSDYSDNSERSDYSERTN